jgi:hypothetical protein
MKPERKHFFVFGEGGEDEEIPLSLETGTTREYNEFEETLLIAFAFAVWLAGLLVSPS